MQAIQTTELTKQYKTLTAVNKLNLEIKQGELFSLLGVNGAGKTTAIKMLKANKPYGEISEFTELTMSDIRELAASLHIVH